MTPEAYTDALTLLGAADTQHLNGELITHLQGTHDLLQAWGCNSSLCLAGLFHATYGTAGFESALIGEDARARLEAIIGKEAEAQVYLYCACDRKRVFDALTHSGAIPFYDRFNDEAFVLTREQAENFCTLTVANELELALQSDAFKAQHGQALRNLFDRMQRFLPEQAVQAYQTALADQAK